MDSMMLEGPRLVEAHPGEEGEMAEVKLSTLKQKWEALQREAEQRSAFFFFFNCIWPALVYDSIPTGIYLMTGEPVWSSFCPWPSSSRMEWIACSSGSYPWSRR